MGGQGSGGKRKGAGRPEGKTAPESRVIAVRLEVSLIEEIEKAEGTKISEWLKWVCLEHRDDDRKKKGSKILPAKKETKPKPTNQSELARRIAVYTSEVAQMEDRELDFDETRFTALSQRQDLGDKPAIEAFLAIVKQEKAKRAPALRIKKAFDEARTVKDVARVKRELRAELKKGLPDPSLLALIEREETRALRRSQPTKETAQKPTDKRQITLPGVSGRKKLGKK